MRRHAVLAVLHRWLGLFTALFLFLAGLTGAVISWDHEVDAWLNPQLYDAGSHGPPRDALELARAIERDDARLRVTYLPLAAEPGQALRIFVAPRVDPATGAPYALDFNQLAVDPATGAVQARREWGAVSLARENLLPFLYKLHYSLHIPASGSGVELGMWLMGAVGIVWIFDSLIALWLSFPRRALWRRSFQFRWDKGPRAATFDLHRSGGVWVWALLLMIAVTSVSMNFEYEIVRPLVSSISPLTPTPFDTRAARPPDQPIEPRVSRERIAELAREAGERRGWTAPVGALFYAPEYGVYGAGYFAAGHDHGDGGLGNPWLYFDGESGMPLGGEVPGEGSAGDVFMQAQFPIHSGRILGTPGRALMSALGLVVATLSATGLVLWVRKRRAARAASEAPDAAPLVTEPLRASRTGPRS